MSKDEYRRLGKELCMRVMFSICIALFFSFKSETVKQLGGVNQSLGWSAEQKSKIDEGHSELDVKRRI